MIRYIIYEPSTKTYIRLQDGYWTSGFLAEEVNSFASLREARNAADRFDSLKNAEIQKVEKVITLL